LAEVNSMAAAFGQAATHAPLPMHAAASNAVSAASFGTRMAFASGALPVGAPRLERERVTIFEKAHRELAHGGPTLAAMGHAVDQETTRAADPLPAVMFEGNGRLLPVKEVLIEGIEPFKK